MFIFFLTGFERTVENTSLVKRVKTTSVVPLVPKMGSRGESSWTLLPSAKTTTVGMLSSGRSLMMTECP